MLSELLEFAMLFAFGFSWPFAIMRTYRAKRVDGKSPAFMIIVLIGYLFRGRKIPHCAPTPILIYYVVSKVVRLETSGCGGTVFALSGGSFSRRFRI